MFLSLATLTADAVDTVEVVVVEVVVSGASGTSGTVEVVVVEVVVVEVVAVVAVVVVVFVSDKICGALHLKQEGQTSHLTKQEKVIVHCACWKFRHSRDNFLLRNQHIGKSENPSLGKFIVMFPLF